LFKKPSKISIGAVFVLTCTVALAQSAPSNVSQVVIWSTLTSTRTFQSFTAVNGATFTPNAVGSMPQSLLSVYTEEIPKTMTSDAAINSVQNYGIANQNALARALSANIAISLSAIPIESPTSGSILKKDPATGAALSTSGTLGPIFTQRAETIGKGRLYIGFTHQNYHFTSINGKSLNGVSVMYSGGDGSGIVTGSGQSTTTVPATVNLGLDVRLAQDIAFLTYGVTDRFDVSVGLPSVHAAVASTAYYGIIYSGTGTGFTPSGQCWCVNTFTPGTFSLIAPQIGQASYGKSGFGDLLLRLKGKAMQRRHSTLAIGTDLRFPTGDANNYLGTGATSVTPYFALSFYTTPAAHGIVLAPHLDAGWQFSGSSILGGSLQASPKTAQFGTLSVPYLGAPLVATKGTLPDIFHWAAGTEIALGPRNTIVVDFLGNQIGWINGMQTLQSQSIDNNKFSAPANAPFAQKDGLVGSLKNGSMSQYSGAFGYKVKVVGNLVASFQTLVRFDNSGLVARITPLYGLGYGF
jgi:hypothetical protein